MAVGKATFKSQSHLFVATVPTKKAAGCGLGLAARWIDFVARTNHGNVPLRPAANARLPVTLEGAYAQVVPCPSHMLVRALSRLFPFRLSLPVLSSLIASQRPSWE